MQGTGWVIFWLIFVGLLAAGLVRYYFHIRPHPRFARTGLPADMERSVGRHKTIVQWDHGYTMKDCPACGGFGVLLYRDRRKHVIPREQWHAALWRLGNTVRCPGCHGLGYVSKNWRPPRHFRWPVGSPVPAA